ncbi:MAG: type II toxin-antitoxin system VapC family toxin [Terriglobales bacterium]
MILVDTHVVVWLAGNPGKLSRRAVRAIEQARRDAGGLAISGFTLFELAHLVARKRIRVDSSLESFLQEVESHFVVLPINGRIAARAVQLPQTYPSDPMDRIIGATALVEGLPLVTADEHIQRSRVVKTIW